MTHEELVEQFSMMEDEEMDEYRSMADKIGVVRRDLIRYDTHGGDTEEGGHPNTNFHIHVGINETTTRRNQRGREGMPSHSGNESAQSTGSSMGGTNRKNKAAAGIWEDDITKILSEECLFPPLAYLCRTIEVNDHENWNSFIGDLCLKGDELIRFAVYEKGRKEDVGYGCSLCDRVHNKKYYSEGFSQHQGTKAHREACAKILSGFELVGYEEWSLS